MSKTASAIITKTEFLWSKFSDSHLEIRKEHGIDENQIEITAVPCELSPKDNDYKIPLSDWIFTIDLSRDQWPEWFSEKDAEKQFRDILPKWAETHIYKTGHHIFDGGNLSLIFMGEATAEIKNQTGGVCWFYDSSTGTVTGQTGGMCRFYESSTGTVTGQTGGECRFYESSF